MTLDDQSSEVVPDLEAVDAAGIEDEPHTPDRCGVARLVCYIQQQEGDILPQEQGGANPSNDTLDPDRRKPGFAAPISETPIRAMGRDICRRHEGTVKIDQDGYARFAICSHPAGSGSEGTGWAKMFIHNGFCKGRAPFEGPGSFAAIFDSSLSGLES